MTRQGRAENRLIDAKVVGVLGRVVGAPSGAVVGMSPSAFLGGSGFLDDDNIRQFWPNATVTTVFLVCALSVSGAIFLILELDRSFEGMIQISSAPLLQAVGHLGQ